MRRAAMIVIGTILALNSACAPIVREVRYPGGYPGYLLDKRTFNASGRQQLQLLRATLILAMAARMSHVTVAGEDAEPFARHLAAAVQEINYAAADLYPVPEKTGTPCTTLGTNENGCFGYYANFESDMPIIEARLLRVMLAVLPTSKARAFLDDVSNGDVMSAAWSAFRTLASAAGGLHFATGAYRSGLEVVAESMAKCVPEAKLPSGKTKFESDSMTVMDAARCLGLSDEDLFKNENEARREELSGEIKQGAFFALMRIVASSCVALPYAGSGDELTTARNSRREACNAIAFKPAERPYRIDEPEEDSPGAGG